MHSSSTYTPPKVWKWESENGGEWANINRPTAGPTHNKELPIGQHPLQLYSLATPNGVKVTIMLEELLLKGFDDAEYDAFLIDISEGEQFASGFVDINPNSKIPALMDHSTTKPIRVFESGSILMYLAEKFGVLIPNDLSLRTECLSWLFWQVSSAPYLGGGFGHFYSYAPIKLEYSIDRFAMEVKRQFDVLDRHLIDRRYLCGDAYSIADIAVWPWYGCMMLDNFYEAAEFLDVASYKNLTRWAREIRNRPAVQRGEMVNLNWGPVEKQLRERHDATDFDALTQFKLKNTAE
jgi:GST-like protein